MCIWDEIQTEDGWDESTAETLAGQLGRWGLQNLKGVFTRNLPNSPQGNTSRRGPCGHSTPEAGSGELSLGDLLQKVEEADLGVGWLGLHGGVGAGERRRRSRVCLVGCVTGGVFTLTGSKGEGAPCAGPGSRCCASLSELWPQLWGWSRVHI